MKWITVILITALSLATGCRSGEYTKLKLESPTVPGINPLLGGERESETLREPDLIFVDASATGRGLGLEGSVNTTQQVLIGVGFMGTVFAGAFAKGAKAKQKRIRSEHIKELMKRRGSRDGLETKTEIQQISLQHKRPG